MCIKKCLVHKHIHIGTRLRIAGKAPPRALLEAATRAGAEIEPDVRSMPVEFARAALLVVPLWTGAGARVRIVEALAAGLPVVSTPTGAEGLGLEPGAHFAEAETPTALAEAVTGLLRDRARLDAMGRAGQAFAERGWALPAVARLQNDLIAQVIR